MNVSKALQYVVNGYSVIPVGKNKRPLLAWEENQKTRATEDDLSLWNEKYPEAGIGIVTGKISGITVIDIDVKNTTKTPLETFPQTYTVQTPSGGYHLYYEHTDHVYTCANQFPEYPYVDIRNDGGYVVAPPTSGYTVHTQMPLQPFPTHLFKSTKKKKKNMQMLVNVSTGGRNESITTLIGKMLYTANEDTWEKEVFPVIVAINNTYKPPLPLEELKTTFMSIARIESARRRESVPSPFAIPVEERIEIQLRKNKNGAVYKDMVNVLLALQQHPELKDAIKFNTFRGRVEYNNDILTEGDLLHIQSVIQDSILPGISKQIVDDAIQKHAFNNTYDEALDWVKSLQWDGTPRLHNWLPTVAHVEDSQYHRSVGAQWFLGMMKRLVKPGCIFDYVLVLVGPQGVGKTSLFRIIGGDWYKSYSGGLETKDFYLSLSGALIVDLDEGVTMYKSESIKMKSIITQTVDEYRAPYARRPEQHPRRFVFSMSTNDIEPFQDATGNRRYLPITLGNEQIDFNWLSENREQLFAEAYFAVTNNIEHEQIPIDIALQMQEERYTEDEWTETISNYLEQSLLYCTGSPEFEVTISELFEKALRENVGKIERRHQMRLGNILRKLGLYKKRVMYNGDYRNRYVLTDEAIKRRQEYPLDQNHGF